MQAPGRPSHPSGQPLGRAARQVAAPPVWGRVHRTRIDHLTPRPERLVEHRRNRLRRMLQILIHGDDPVAQGTGHPGQRGRVLAEVPGEPERSHPVELLRQRLHRDVGSIRSAVVYEHDLFDAPRQPSWSRGCSLQFTEARQLRHQRAQRALPLVDRHHHRDAFHCPVHPEFSGAVHFARISNMVFRNTTLKPCRSMKDRYVSA